VYYQTYDVYIIPITDVERLWPFYANRNELDGFFMLNVDRNYLINRGLIERTDRCGYRLTQAGKELLHDKSNFI
jgi:hypothetical protein